MAMADELIGYGFVDSISIPGQRASSYERLDIVLDLISAKAFDLDNGANRNVDDLSVVRIMTTEGRLEDLFGLERIVEGSWLKVVLGDSPGNPLAWILGAREDYGGTPIRANVIGMEEIRQQQDSLSTQLFVSLTKLCSPVQPQSGQSNALQPSIVPGQTGYKLRIVDVGQASFCAIHTREDPNSPILGYFDVGGPVFFHHRTFPPIFPEAARIPNTGFVALSHWDFDHYSLAVTSLKALQKLQWFAPSQAVGPNAARLQTLLGANLTLLSSNSFTIGQGLELHRGTGLIDDRNNNGFVLTASVAGGRALLTGDASYDMIPAVAQANLVALNVSHHGGASTGTPPTPSVTQGVAAVSYGIPNRYRHPDAKRLVEHQKLGWKVRPTNPTPSGRGDVWLG